MSSQAAPSNDPRPLIAHVVFRFDYGGLENGVVNIVNGLPEDEFRHVIIALTEATSFRERIRRGDVSVHALNKRPGKDPAAYIRLHRLLRQLRPSVVHTRNLGTIEGAWVGFLAGVPARIHGEHGWDIYDADGTNPKHRAMRRLASPAVHRFVTVSREIEEWLVGSVGVRRGKIQRICNGVDISRFQPRGAAARRLVPPELVADGAVVIGSVTRFSEIKDPLNLVRGFIEARRAAAGSKLRLVMIGDGSLRAEAWRLVAEAGVQSSVWLPGSRDDVPALMQEMDVFVLASKREGISNTVLEAMGSGLPVVASATGGNLELVEDGRTGQLVPAGDSAALASVLLGYAASPEQRARHGAAGRQRAIGEYSLERMLRDYRDLYRGQCLEVGEVA
jgi:sugar transferase (PEP-CTERM/EpsH1 system associated)